MWFADRTSHFNEGTDIRRPRKHSFCGIRAVWHKMADSRVAVWLGLEKRLSFVALAFVYLFEQHLLVSVERCIE